MKYELAKQLAEAGFTQGGRGMWVDEKENILGYRSSPSQFYIPIIDELIDACDAELGGLFIQSRKGSSVAWEATPFLNKMLPDGTAGRLGPTPVEALVRFWLAVNKKI